MKRILIGLSGALLLISCSKEEVKNRIEEPKLMKVWETACVNSALLDIAGLESHRSYVEFSGDKFTEVYTLYTDDTCGAPGAEARTTGTFVLGDSVQPGSGAKPLNLSYQNSSVIALNEEGRQVLDGVDLCGVTEPFEVGKPVDVTANSASKLCPVKQAPSAAYTIYKIDGESLLLGASGSRSDTEQNRPTDLDTKTPYGPSNRDL